MTNLLIATITEGNNGVKIDFVSHAAPSPVVDPSYLRESIPFSAGGTMLVQNPASNGIIINFQDGSQPLEVSIEDPDLIALGFNQTMDFVYLNGTTVTATTNQQLADEFNRLLDI